ncbi:pyrroline-5-carboxylate reductase [Marinomonas epiphytica]
MSVKVAFIGVGNMATAIFSGMIAGGFPAEYIIGTSRTEEKRAALEAQYGIRMLDNNQQAVSEADVVVLCVKPAQMQDVIAGFAEQVHVKQLFISVAAGVELNALQHWLNKKVAIVRSMPNTPSQLGAGITGLIANSLLSDEQREWTSSLFSSIGESVWVETEEQMHTVTSLSGSSPAYFFRFLESMIANGVEQGMSEQNSRKLATQAMLGAARMVTELDEPITQLRKKITSPNGTTEQAVLSLEASGIDTIVGTAMTACANRSKEMAKDFSAK